MLDVSLSVLLLRVKLFLQMSYNLQSYVLMGKFCDLQYIRCFRGRQRLTEQPEFYVSHLR